MNHKLGTVCLEDFEHRSYHDPIIHTLKILILITNLIGNDWKVLIRIPVRLIGNIRFRH